MKRAVRTFIGAIALCCLLTSGGCGSALQSAGVGSPLPSTARVDWGMSLLGGGGVGTGQFPAKFSFDANTSPDCVNDFVVYNTSKTGSAGAVANIMAFNELYSTQGSVGGLCEQDGPSVYWSYFTGNGNASTSVAFSLDGTKVAYVENGAATATLRILKWKAGEGSAPDSPAPVDQDISGLPWTECLEGNSCVASVAFNGNTHDTRSAPFVNYDNDVIYVGDSTGALHKFTGVFNGTPTEVTTGWPITVNATRILSSPVYDSVSGNIFVGDSAGRLSYVLETSTTVGFCGTGVPPCLGAATVQVGIGGGAIVDGPIVDGTDGTVFAVNGTGLSHGTITQADTQLSTSVSFKIGGSGGGILYGGAFDQTYLNSSPGSVEGFMYVCGKDPAQSNRPAIFQLSFTPAGILNSVGTPLLMNSTSDGAVCSPITEIVNTGSSSASGEWIFFSIGNFAADTAPIPIFSNCRIDNDFTDGNAGCMVGINITNAANPGFNPGGTWPPQDAFFDSPGGNNANATPLPGTIASSSGIIIDNVSAESQASNLYFSLGTFSRGSGPGLPSCNTTPGIGCAVKLTQSNLN